MEEAEYQQQVDKEFGMLTPAAFDAIEAQRTSTEWRYVSYIRAIREAVYTVFPGNEEAVRLMVGLCMQESSLRRAHSFGRGVLGDSTARGIAQIKGFGIRALSVSASIAQAARMLLRYGWDGGAATLSAAYGAYGFGETGFRSMGPNDPTFLRINRLRLAKTEATRAYAAFRSVAHPFTGSVVAESVRQADLVAPTRRPRVSDGVHAELPVAANVTALYAALVRPGMFTGGARGIRRPRARVHLIEAGRQMDQHNAGLALDVPCTNEAIGTATLKYLAVNASTLGVTLAIFGSQRWVATRRFVWQRQEDLDHFNHLHIELVEGGEFVPTYGRAAADIGEFVNDERAALEYLLRGAP